MFNLESIKYITEDALNIIPRKETAIAAGVGATTFTLKNPISALIHKYLAPVTMAVNGY